jgi:O-6-methylguanine DNA methyltransferase
LNTSPRAIGNACGKNSLLIIIPCHRVISVKGKLTGFSALGGIKTKEKLLQIEATKI